LQVDSLVIPPEICSWHTQVPTSCAFVTETLNIKIAGIINIIRVNIIMYCFIQRHFITQKG